MIDIQNQLKAFPLKPLEVFRDFLNKEITRRGGSEVKPLDPKRPFRIGDKAKFKDRSGIDRIIAVTRINEKSITGRELGGSAAKWRVSPILLTHVED